MSTLHNTIISVNNKIKAVRALLGPLFPISHDYQTELDLKDMESLAVDGAPIRKVQMVNKRILEYNPRWQVIHCGCHWVALVCSHSTKENDRHAEAHNVSCKLFDLENASRKFEVLFKECHIQTGEAQAWKGGEPVALSDRPMHRWESTLKFERKILKLLQSNKQTTIYPANWLRKKFPHVNYLVTLAVEADILEILVNFI